MLLLWHVDAAMPSIHPLPDLTAALHINKTQPSQKKNVNQADEMQ